MSRPKYGWMTREAGDSAALTYHGTVEQETLASEMIWSSAKQVLSGNLPSTRATGIPLVWEVHTGFVQYFPAEEGNSGNESTDTIDSPRRAKCLWAQIAGYRAELSF